MTTYLFFDLDGTLMINPFWKVVFPRMSASIAQQAGVSADDVMDAIMGLHDERIANPLPQRAATMDWEDILQQIADRYGATLPTTAEQLVCDHAAPPDTATIDDAVQVLEQLQALHRRFVVATMGLGKYQLPVMDALGLTPFFEKVLTPDSTQYLKVDAEFYRDFLHVNGLRIHIGDRYDHDCYYPKQFGSKAILRVPADKAPHEDWLALSPFDRAAAFAEVKDEISGAMPQAETLPDAVVIHLQELNDVIPTLEANHAK